MVLSLTCRGMVDPPEELLEISELQKLNLHKQIAHIPVCIYTMKSLAFLDMACNRLENITEKIQALADLKIPIMEGNYIHSLPRMFGCLTELELLNVDYNEIQNITAEMHQLTSLGKLACHPLDKGLHIMYNPLSKPIKEVLDGGLQGLYNYLKAN
uniref:Uncharacterized protein n=1 Tax=Electrophorus electricus TaxID=8005 RepID=A0A4W4DQ06_ELEEL